MKGHRVVIEAAARLAARRVGARTSPSSGAARMEPAVREAIARAGLEAQVTFAASWTTCPAVMAALDLALYVPLESDGMSRVVFEYLAAGRPLIASRVGVVPEVLADGEHAVLVPAGDAGRAGRRRSSGLLDDAPRRARLGEAGRRLVRRALFGRARWPRRSRRHYARLTAA